MAVELFVGVVEAFGGSGGAEMFGVGAVACACEECWSVVLF